MSPTDLQLANPSLLTDQRSYVQSTDTKPAIADDGSDLEVGAELQEVDTGRWFFWNGSAWQLTTPAQKLDQLIEINIEIRNILRDAFTDEE